MKLWHLAALGTAAYLILRANKNGALLGKVTPLPKCPKHMDRVRMRNGEWRCFPKCSGEEIENVTRKYRRYLRALPFSDAFYVPVIRDRDTGECGLDFDSLWATTNTGNGGGGDGE